MVMMVMIMTTTTTTTTTMMMMMMMTFLCTEVSPHMAIYRRNIYEVSSFLITNTKHGMNYIFYTDIFNFQKLLRRPGIVHLAVLWSHASLLFTVVYIL